MNMKMVFQILAILFLNCSSSFAQTLLDTLKNNLYKVPYSYSKLKEDLSAYKAKHVVTTYETDLDFGAKTLNCYFIGLNPRYQLTAHVIDDTVFSLEILKFDEESETGSFTSDFQFIDTLKAYQYLSLHNNHYRANSKASDFFSKEFERFGYACGLAVYTPESMMKCLALVKNRDRKALLIFAKSVNATDRV